MLGLIVVLPAMTALAIILRDIVMWMKNMLNDAKYPSRLNKFFALEFEYNLRRHVFVCVCIFV